MCVTITKGGKAITEDRMYEKKTAHTRNYPNVRPYAYKKLRVKF